MINTLIRAGFIFARVDAPVSFVTLDPLIEKEECLKLIIETIPYYILEDVITYCVEKELFGHIRYLMTLGLNRRDVDVSNLFR